MEATKSVNVIPTGTQKSKLPNLSSMTHPSTKKIMFAELRTTPPTKEEFPDFCRFFQKHVFELRTGSQAQNVSVFCGDVKLVIVNT
jgi:hypothetical protein